MGLLSFIYLHCAPAQAPAAWWPVTAYTFRLTGPPRCPEMGPHIPSPRPGGWRTVWAGGAWRRSVSAQEGRHRPVSLGPGLGELPNPSYSPTLCSGPAAGNHVGHLATCTASRRGPVAYMLTALPWNPPEPDSLAPLFPSTQPQVSPPPAPPRCFLGLFFVAAWCASTPSLGVKIYLFLPVPQTVLWQPSCSPIGGRGGSQLQQPCLSPPLTQ